MAKVICSNHTLECSCDHSEPHDINSVCSIKCGHQGGFPACEEVIENNVSEGNVDSRRDVAPMLVGPTPTRHSR
jgi:hypothetical protein